MKVMNLLTRNNTKILKGRDRGYLVHGMHLSPGWLCPRASSGCLRACLNTAGHGIYRRTQEARARKSKLFKEHTLAFLELLEQDIIQAEKYALKKNLIPVFRLNLTSDIPWECYGIPQKFPHLQFYDYTKISERHPPDNYHLTFSRSESLSNHLEAKQWLQSGSNVAVVFHKALPQTYWNYPVVSGDEDDLRFLDPKPVIIGLSAKGRGKKDTTGFVV